MIASIKTCSLLFSASKNSLSRTSPCLDGERGTVLLSALISGDPELVDADSTPPQADSTDGPLFSAWPASFRFDPFRSA